MTTPESNILDRYPIPYEIEDPLDVDIDFRKAILDKDKFAVCRYGIIDGKEYLFTFTALGNTPEEEIPIEEWQNRKPILYVEVASSTRSKTTKMHVNLNRNDEMVKKGRPIVRFIKVTDEEIEFDNTISHTSTLKSLSNILNQCYPAGNIGQINIAAQNIEDKISAERYTAITRLLIPGNVPEDKSPFLKDTVKQLKLLRQHQPILFKLVTDQVIQVILTKPGNRDKIKAIQYGLSCLTCKKDLFMHHLRKSIVDYQLELIFRINEPDYDAVFEALGYANLSESVLSHFKTVYKMRLKKLQGIGHLKDLFNNQARVLEAKIQVIEEIERQRMNQMGSGVDA